MRGLTQNAFRGGCSRRGKPIHRSDIGQRTSFSAKVECKATVQLSFVGISKGELTFNEGHCSACISGDVTNNGRILKYIISPEKVVEVVNKAAAIMGNDRSLSNSRVGKQIQPVMSVLAGLLDGDILPIVPDSFSFSILKKARIQASGAVGEINDGVSNLISECDRLNVKYEIFKDENGLVSSLHMMDPELAPPEEFTIKVLMSDVTFGITSPQSGFYKWSSWNAVTFTHAVHLLQVSAIKTEDGTTFCRELSILIDLYPEIGHEVIVFIVDGDRAKWLAIRTLCRRAVLIMCVYHGNENVKDRLGSLCRTSIRNTSTAIESVSINWIACAKCNKWRELPSCIAPTSISGLFYCCNQSNGSCDIPSTYIGDSSPVIPMAKGPLVDVEYNVDEELAPESATLNDDTVHEMYSKLLSQGALGQLNWYSLWNYIKSGHNIVEVRRRLDQLTAHYPTTKDYFDFLWLNVSTWANCCFTWERTYNLRASSLAESVHWTWKCRLGKQLLTLGETPAFFRKAMKGRHISRKRRREHLCKAVNLLKEEAYSKGCSKISKCMTLFLSDEAQALVFPVLSRSFGQYVVEELKSSQEIEAAIARSIVLRKASAYRFKCLADKVFSQPRDDNSAFHGAFYEVTSVSPIHRTIDIVYVSTNGSIACTRPEYGKWGHPCQVIFAVFLVGKIQINAILHFGKEYHRMDYSQQGMDFLSKASATADGFPFGSSTIIPVTTLCSPNYALDFTDMEWKSKGLCAESFPHAANPVIHEVRIGLETKKETLKKMSRSLTSMCERNNPESNAMYESYLKFYNSTISDYNQQAATALHARAVALGLEKQEHVVVPVKASISSKRKTKDR